MMWLSVLTYALIFVLGVTVGVLGHAAWVSARTRLAAARDGHTGPMTLVQRLTLGLTLVCMIATGISSLGYVRNSTNDRRDLTCQVNYNRLDGQARDERDAAARATTRAELRMWRTFLAESRRGATPADYRRTVQLRVDALVALQEARTANPYPDPDQCAR